MVPRTQNLFPGTLVGRSTRPYRLTFFLCFDGTIQIFFQDRGGEYIKKCTSLLNYSAILLLWSNTGKMSRKVKNIPSVFHVKPMLPIVWVVLLLLFSFKGWTALLPESLIPEYLIDSWNSRDGLPSNGVLAAAQSGDGYLWLATSRGLVRFDGLVFTPVNFLNSDIKINTGAFPEVLLTDREGLLWLGSSAGLSSYSYLTRTFYTYTPDMGFPHDRIRLIYQDSRGDYWISFDVEHVARLSHGEFTVFNDSHGLGGNMINAIVEDAGGNLLFGTREKGVYCYREGRFYNHLIKGLDQNYKIITMLVDREKSLWIGTNKGLFRVSPKGDTVEIMTVKHGLASDYITNIIEDRQGNLWVGTVNGLNLMKHSSAGNFSLTHFLKNIVVTCLYLDREGSLWIGTLDSGLRRLKETRFFSYTIEENKNNVIVLSLYKDRQDVTWIGTLSGRLYRCRGTRVLETLDIPDIAGNGISAITSDTFGNLYLGTNGKGVMVGTGSPYRFAAFTTENGLADNMVVSLFIDSKNRLWIATFGGVSCYQKGLMEIIKIGPGQTQKVYNIYETPDGLILIAMDKGIKIWKEGALIENQITAYFKDIPVTCIFTDSGKKKVSKGENNITRSGAEPVYWIGTSGSGLICCHGNSFSPFTVEQGMTTNYIYQIYADERQNLWLMSNSGVLRVAKKDLFALAAGKIQRLVCTSFGIADGMNSIEFNNMFSRHSALETRAGEIWFVTRRGITTIKPNTLKINEFPPPVIIENVIINGNPLSFAEVSLSKRVAPPVHEVVFYFTAPTFLSPEKVTFRYRLMGIHQDWRYVSPGQERQAKYINLGSGDYTFDVNACNSDGVWNPTGVALSFSIATPFFQRIWVRLSVLFLVLVLVMMGFRRYRKFVGFRQMVDNGGLKSGELEDEQKYKRSPMNPVFADECLKKLTLLVEEEKIYKDEALSLPVLAERLGLTPHQLSQLLNEKLNKSFSEFINAYRIEAAKLLLRDPHWKDRKIMAIAFEVGFNTKAAFYQVFKKVTQMTPSQFRDMEPQDKGHTNG